MTGSPAAGATGRTSGAGPRSVYGSQALVAVMVVVVAQVSRVLFPIMFEIGEDWDFVLVGLVTVGVFSAPILMLLLPRSADRAGAVAGSLAAAASLVVLRALDPIPAAVAVIALAIVLVGATLVMAALVSDLRRGPLVLLSGLILGLALDAVIKAGFGSWDLAWQRGMRSLTVTIVVAVALPMLAITFVADTQNGTGRRWRGGVALAIGAYLMLQLLFLHNSAFVASQAGLSAAPATLVVLMGSLAALGAMYLADRWQPGRAVAAVLGVLGGALVWVVADVTGWPGVLVVLGVQVILTGLLTIAIGGSEPTSQHSGRARQALAITGGSVLFLVLVLLWQIDIDRPLPFPRQAIPLAAMAVVLWVAWRGHYRHEPEANGGMVFPVVLPVAVLAVMMPTALWLTAADVAPVVGRNEVRLVDYNVRGAVGIDGRLGPDDIVAEIASSDPDIVLLQEVARGWAIHGTMDLLAHLEGELGMASVFAPAADGQFGNAILSRFPMSGVSSESLPKDGTQDRSYLWVRVDTPSGPLDIVGTHTQTRSVEQLTALLEAIGDTTPLVLAGDMNVHPNDPEVMLFTDAGLVDVVGLTGDPCRTTSAEPTSSCDRPDWVFVTPNIGVDAVRIGSAGASDHLAIHVALRPDD